MSMIWSTQTFQNYSFPQNKGQPSEYDRLVRSPRTEFDALIALRLHVNETPEC